MTMDTQLGMEASRFRPHRYALARGDKFLCAPKTRVSVEIIRMAKDYLGAQEPIMDLTPQMELDEHDMTTGDYAIPGQVLEEVSVYQKRREAFVDPQLTAKYSLPGVEDRVTQVSVDELIGLGKMAATAQLYRGRSQALETSLQDTPIIDPFQQPFPGPSDMEIDQILDTLGAGKHFMYAQTPQTTPLYGLYP
ncbi:MAG: hypothetical protein KJ597_05455 [Nanoarchaeota archaeon]|nr:hypothetical protein [Nanoarchaeota archaeon]